MIAAPAIGLSWHEIGAVGHPRRAGRGEGFEHLGDAVLAALRASTLKHRSDRLRSKWRVGFLQQVANGPNLSETIGWPTDFLNQPSVDKLSLDLFAACDLMREARFLVLRAKPADLSAPFFRRALLIECDQADNQFLFGGLLILALVTAGSGRSRLADDPLA